MTPFSIRRAAYCSRTLPKAGPKGGGVRTYLRHKRRHILDNTPHRHLLVVPGQRDDLDIEADGRGMTVTIASPKVPGSPHYRLMPLELGGAIGAG